MNTYYTVTNYLKEIFQENIDVKTVVFGKQNELDLYKKTLFALVHIVPLNAGFNDNCAIYSFRIIILDQRDINKLNETDKFEHNDNQIDNLNLTDAILRYFILKIRGSYNDNDIELVSYSDAEPVLLSSNNLLDGWYIDCTFQIPNNISIC